MPTHELTIETSRHAEMIDITAQVADAVSAAGAQDGMCFVYVPHTTAGVTINENADPAVRQDIERVLDGLVPWDDDYAHAEGNSAAHIKATLVGSTVAIPIDAGRLRLGAWQGIYFCEFDGPRTRQALVKILAG